MPMTGELAIAPGRAALAGAAAAAVGLGLAELLAGLLPGASSPVIAVGDLIIALQPPGAKQLVVDLFGEADKLVLNLVVAGVAIGVIAYFMSHGTTNPLQQRDAIVQANRRDAELASGAVTARSHEQVMNAARRASSGCGG